ncbi:MAG TPA: hypothetical protein VLE95_03360 [Chlamydiales bacterium]|nr:hypothetical protein [Chlamydiales bacterium]
MNHFGYIRILCLTTLIIASFGLLYFVHVRKTPSDFSCYRRLVQESQDLHAQGALAASSVCQSRFEVAKDIWMTREGKRSHSHIQSAQSNLILTQKKEKMDGIERVQDLEGWFDFEDKIYHFSAESGLCHFPSYNIKLEHPLMDCLGQEAARANRASFESMMGLNGIKSKILFLNGDLRLAFHLRSKESFAMADAGRFHIDEKKMILESAAPHRVLFQQQDLSISAPAITIEKAVQGMGDVRFFFYPDEEYDFICGKKPG